MIRLVCGSGRCGSSLAMQMLQAGGVEVVGHGPYFEPKETVWHQFDVDWLIKQAGVVKLLHPIPAIYKFPPGEYRSIWLTRCIKDQAKSILKFTMAEHMVPEEDQDLGKIELDLFNESRVNNEALCQLGPMYTLPFDHLLTDPRGTARRMLEYFSLEGDVDKMACVVQDRPVESLPDMSLEDKLIEEYDQKSSQDGDRTNSR